MTIQIRDTTYHTYNTGNVYITALSTSKAASNLTVENKQFEKFEKLIKKKLGRW